MATTGHETEKIDVQGLKAALQKFKTDKVDGKVGQTISKTWAELKAMRDGGTLVPGQWYRITDYECTTTQENTQSAGHVFDIIVRADETNALNENAYAAHHAGDTYFANSNLAAWRLWYYLDNDTTKFDWADNTNGKGVIYRMIDEHENDIPYDFKNIQTQVAGGVKSVTIGAPYPGPSNITGSRDQNQDTYISSGQVYAWSDDSNTFWTTSLTPSVGDYVYQRQNGDLIIQGWSIRSMVVETALNYYLFDNDGNDASLGNGVYLNKIYPYLNTNNKQIFENNRFIGCNVVYGNIFRGQFYGNIISCNYFNGNTALNFYNNTISCDSFYRNDCGPIFCNNKIVRGFCDNNITDQFDGNNISRTFTRNLINEFNNNTCSGTSYIMSENIIASMTSCSVNSGDFKNNTVLGEVFNLYTSYDIKYTTFEGDVSEIHVDGGQLISSFIYNSSSIYINCFCNKVRIYNSKYTRLSCTQTTSSSSYVTNLIIQSAKGRGASSGRLKDITHSSVLDDFITTYQPTGSTTVNV